MRIADIIHRRQGKGLAPYNFAPATNHDFGRNWLKGIPRRQVTSRKALLKERRSWWHSAAVGYRPHQGARECARRRRQMAKAAAKAEAAE